MKKLCICLLGICAALLFVQCDKIEEPFMEAGDQKVTADTPYFEVKTQFIQKYLLEEFTGHTCLNCPKAHKIMHSRKWATPWCAWPYIVEILQNREMLPTLQTTAPP